MKKKELFTLAFKDGNNKAFNGGRCYIPNAQRWIFDLMFKHCLPIFWGKHICHNVRLLMTDGCTEEYLPFITNCRSSFLSSVHGLCYFHLAIQGFKNNVTPFLPKIRKNKYSPAVAKVVSTIRYWVKTWVFYI